MTKCKTIMIVGSFAESLINFRGPLICEMVKSGHRVIACAPNASEKIIDQIKEMGAEFADVPLNRTGLNPFMDLFSITRLYFSVKLKKPDMLLAYTIKPVIYGSLAGKIARVQFITSMITGLGYNYVAKSIKAKILSRISNVLYKMSLAINNLIIFQNCDDRSFFQNNGLIGKDKKTIIVNGSGIDIEHFAVAKLPSIVSFLLIARLIKEKGVREYYEAAKIIKREFKNIRFALVGWVDSSPNSLSEEEIAVWVEEGIIDFLGKKEDVRPCLTECSVYVLPSYREGTPRTVLEAMSMGRPIITTDAPGCRQTTINGVNGFLVPVSDVMALAGAMRKFITDPELIAKMGCSSRQIAERKYDVRIVNREILTQLGLI